MNDIDLTIEQGQSLALTGHNGCGKSTLLKITAGLVRPTTGTVCLEKGKLIHYVPEHFPQMCLTAKQYLLYMGKMERMESVELEAFIQKIRELQKHNVTILMSCHEPYLVDAIADEVYQFIDGKIVLTNHKSADETQWYTMLFVRTKKADIPERWKGHLQFTEQGCTLRAAESECNRAIVEMLEAGWNLGGMYNESDK